MLRRIAERSRAVVVHNPAAARIVREHAPARPWSRDPAPVRPAGAAVRSRSDPLPAAARHRPERFLFGVFGYLRESKRLMAVLEAFARSVAPRAPLLVAGRVRLDRPGTRRRARCSPRPASCACRICRNASSGLAAVRRGCLHQSALSGRRRDVRHRHPSDGNRQAGAGDRLGGVLAISGGCVRTDRARRRGARVAAAAHGSANIDD